MIFRVFGIFILVVFYGCYFIKMFVQRAHGIKTDHIGKDKKGIAKNIEILMKTATVWVFIAELVSICIGTASFDAWVRYLGAVIAIVGDIVFIISVITMKDSWRAGVSENEKTVLVQSGIYSFSRNPAFLGFDLVYIGMMLMFSNLPLCIATVFAAVMLHLQIVNVEEEFLLRAFGEEYLVYKKKVNRYFGRRLKNR